MLAFPPLHRFPSFFTLRWGWSAQSCFPHLPPDHGFSLVSGHPRVSLRLFGIVSLRLPPRFAAHACQSLPPSPPVETPPRFSELFVCPRFRFFSSPPGFFLLSSRYLCLSSCPSFRLWRLVPYSWLPVSASLLPRLVLSSFRLPASPSVPFPSFAYSPSSSLRSSHFARPFTASVAFFSRCVPFAVSSSCLLLPSVFSTAPPHAE